MEHDDEITKRCTLCGVDKPLSAHGKQKGGRFGLHPRCKACRQAAERARYAANRDEILAEMRNDPRRQQYTKEMTRLRRYGVAMEEFVAMSEAQGGRCAICCEVVAPLCLDHDHETGSVRGLLCRSCNVGIGHLRDDPTRLRRAAAYLEEHAARGANILDLTLER